jgi:hypothetical protein
MNQGLDRHYIQSTLKRLAAYYSDRARIALSHARESPDTDSMAHQVIPAIRWEQREMPSTELLRISMYH